ncbi:hypothetical protein BRADI_2g14923v3 [Brachypodium distachyon]|uniref:Uncharacterized protein n=1 Tax=Brachypodium distachyon TaxID=15368 RepID=A0A0Q3FZ53_BRADI|nr:hypothetical protein BRADI_2g14923v3 [Brachypodium distachyon]PNT70636.1 hypothetical protein BRADI_2g14923v3 [Brachypodium distachyon]PNT70637.1 hypothetical protein BRADI_2g14923v3 [Brachypodium distachyon]
MAFNERRGFDRKQACALAGSNNKRGQTCPDQSTCVNGTCANAEDTREEPLAGQLEHTVQASLPCWAGDSGFGPVWFLWAEQSRPWVALPIPCDVADRAIFRASTKIRHCLLLARCLVARSIFVGPALAASLRHRQQEVAHAA